MVRLRYYSAIKNKDSCIQNTNFHLPVQYVDSELNACNSECNKNNVDVGVKHSIYEFYFQGKLGILKCQTWPCFVTRESLHIKA